ncbi:transglutaminase-like cysteine peptidase [Devosia naphthalenivorans]|uniref:transglutaminase-like cysteine peptidase n=1 Tax=Devosia naphthalenivorans TaxID=2082392 RepID=UPI0031832461
MARGVDGPHRSRRPRTRRSGGRVLGWSKTPYSYVKRQSQADAGQWVDLQDNRPTFVAESADIAVGARRNSDHS